MKIGLRVYWSARQEPLYACVDRARAHFDLLAVLSNTSVWYRPGKSIRRGATAIQADDDSVLRALVTKGVNRRDMGRQPIVELGWHVRLWSGGNDEHVCSTSFLCGAYVKQVSNNALIELNGAFDDFDAAGALAQLAGIWDAEHGLVEVDDVRTVSFGG